MNEFYHHGVKGMKWGVRKKRDRVTVRQATKNAEKAYKESLKNDKARSKNGERVTVRQAGINARQAYKDSLKNDKARSKQAAKLNRQDVKNKAADALDKLEDHLFFNGDNIPNNFAVQAGIRTLSSGLRNGDDLWNTTLSAIDDYKFFAD